MSPTRIGSSGAPPSVEPTAETSVRNGVRSATNDRTTLSSVRGEAAGGHEHVGHEQAEGDRDEAEQREAREQRGEEHRRRLPSAQPPGEALGRPAGPGVQHGHRPCVAAHAALDVDRWSVIRFPPRSAGYTDPS